MNLYDHARKGEPDLGFRAFLLKWMKSIPDFESTLGDKMRPLAQDVYLKANQDGRGKKWHEILNEFRLIFPSYEQSDEYLRKKFES
jgi:hypothetical protein